MNDYDLSRTKSEVSDCIHRVGRKLAELKAHHEERGRLEKLLADAGAFDPGSSSAYGDLGGSYGSNVPKTAYTPQPFQKLHDSLGQIQKDESATRASINQLVSSLKEHREKTQQYHTEVKTERANFSSQRSQLQSEAPKVCYDRGERGLVGDIDACKEITDAINGALRSAGAAFSSGSRPSLVGGPLPVRSRTPIEYACEELQNETLYALAKRRNEGIGGTSEPPSPQMAVPGEQRTRSLEGTIGAGLGYATMPVADEYKIPLPKYYYERYRRDCNPHDSQGKYLVRE